MKVKKWEKNICCILATILIFLGMSGEGTIADSFFSCAFNIAGNTETSIYAEDTGITVPAVCTISMLKSGSQTIRSAAGGYTYRWQNKLYFSVFCAAAYLLYRFMYQSAESKEDGQLFLCRSVIVDYIHQKDSGE